ncbi:MAG: diacylglycerol kinase [Woeseiaceae bacterium]|nr:diacylglycerol kinase [Woeseiaceae bacterium]|tara:strand:+ start:2450 stop:2935 length:486 start_codon:yes stop_codon:yes gene_type:complete
MSLSIIVAKSINNVIGIDGDLPWNISEDLKNFKAVTMGKPLLMGRTTYESIGRPLPGRRNMIITRQNDYQVAGADVFLSPESALATIDDAEEVMIIGGGEIYASFFDKVNRIYVTHVEKEINGDTFFPEINYNFWEIVSKQFFPVNEQREVAFWFEVLERR